MWIIWDCLDEEAQKKLASYQQVHYDSKWRAPKKPDQKGIVVDVILEDTSEIAVLMTQARIRE